MAYQPQSDAIRVIQGSLAADCAFDPSGTVEYPPPRDAPPPTPQPGRECEAVEPDLDEKAVFEQAQRSRTELLTG
jgi:hypothetical protein